jgi:hypothetical protein
MKYTNEIEIDLPIERVVKLFDDPENMKHWQPGLISLEHLSGEPGKVGARYKLLYQMGRRKIEMIETITKRDFPWEFAATYLTRGVLNKVSNKFTRLGPDKTRYVTESEFHFSGFMKIIAWLMPGAFRKQSQKFLDDFKKFAEQQ